VGGDFPVEMGIGCLCDNPPAVACHCGAGISANILGNRVAFERKYSGWLCAGAPRSEDPPSPSAATKLTSMYRIRSNSCRILNGSAPVHTPKRTQIRKMPENVGCTRPKTGDAVPNSKKMSSLAVVLFFDQFTF